MPNALQSDAPEIGVLTVAANQDFSEFVRELEPKLKRVLAAHLGSERGGEAMFDALSYAWEHWDRVRGMTNPGGYLYRMAIRKARRKRGTPTFPVEVRDADLPDYEPRMDSALKQLTDRQRVAVLLVHGWGWPVAEAARFLNLSESSIRTHAARGISRLRSLLEVTVDEDT